MNDTAALDNPIWNALTTAHRPLARLVGRAARYPGDVSPLAGLGEPTPEAFAALRELVGPSESVALFTADPLIVPADWEVKQTRWMHQMIWAERLASPTISPVKLTPADVPDMLALTALAKPGPYLQRTIEMGEYFGIRAADGQLVAMTGERLNLVGFTEISAVCTHPDFRGRGLGLELVRFVAERVLGRGKTPFLHVVPENPARRVYERAGLRLRKDIALTIVGRR